MQTEALRRGCRAAYLDTFSYQARPFYEKLGYEVFGTLDDYPLGHQRFFMRTVFFLFNWWGVLKISRGVFTRGPLELPPNRGG